MPLHSSARAFIDAMAAFPEPFDVPLEDFRKASAALTPKGEPLPLFRVEDRVIAGGDGQDLTLRVYVPQAARHRPVVVWAHGGSFVRGDLDTFDAARRGFALATGMIVVAVDQRLAPEACFPAPLEDIHAALLWVHTNGDQYGGDPHTIGVAGESSGANLAAAVALLARDRDGPSLAFQILFCPLVDAACTSASMEALGEGYLLTKRQLLWAYDQYAPGVDRGNPLLSPISAADLAGLPPAAVLTIEFDPVRDEGEAYADRLRAAGVQVAAARIEGMVHHFPGPEAGAVLLRLLAELDVLKSRGGPDA